MKPFILIIGLTILFSCKKENSNRTPFGNYEGTFQRKMGITGPVSQVKLTFSSTDFNGQSQQPKYPAICRGSFSVNSDRISFYDACIWTADFDGSYILDGDFKIEFKKDSLFLTREYNGILYYYDTYKLRKQ